MSSAREPYVLDFTVPHTGYDLHEFTRAFKNHPDVFSVEIRSSDTQMATQVRVEARTSAAVFFVIDALLGHRKSSMLIATMLNLDRPTIWDRVSGDDPV